MKKIIILILLMPLFYKTSAQTSVASTDTVLVGSVDKNYPGGIEAFNIYIKKKVRPPAEAIENKKTGTAYVNFIIEPDGSVSKVCTILAAGNGMDKEVIRVISQSNKWTPATIDNKPVRCFCRAAIQFSADFDKHLIWITAKRID